MSAELHNLEASLKEFLTESNNDNYNSKNASLYKYNNLRVFIDLKKTREPHFIVRVGISEAIYRIGNCERISGGLGSDERYIHRWFEKTSVEQSLKEAWRQAQRLETVQMENEID